MSHTLEALPLQAKSNERMKESAPRSDWGDMSFVPELQQLANVLIAGAKHGASRVITILSVEPERNSSHICFDLARILAASSTRPACLMHAGFEQKQGTSGVIEHPLLVAPNLWGAKLGTGNKGAPATPERLETSLRDLRARYDFVVIDATGTSSSGEGLVLGSASDGVVIVIDAGKTRRKAALRVLETLRAAGVKVLGTVLSGRRLYIPRAIYRHL